MTKSTILKTAITLSILGVSSACLAKLPSLNFVEAGYGQTNIDESFFNDDKFKGFNLAGSYQINESFYIPVRYYKHGSDSSLQYGGGNSSFSQTIDETRELDLSEFAIGIGYALPLSDASLVAFDVSYLNVSVDLDVNYVIIDFENGQQSNRFEDSFSESQSESGVAARAVYQYYFDSGFQIGLGAQYQYVDIDGDSADDAQAVAELMYFFTEGFALKTGAVFGDDSAFDISVRYTF